MNERKKYPVSKTKHKKKYYPKKQHNTKPTNPANFLAGFFNTNKDIGMNFGDDNHEKSGYIKREIIIKDRYGNTQIAREKQFFNSAKSIGYLRVDDNEGEFR